MRPAKRKDNEDGSKETRIAMRKDNDVGGENRDLNG